MRGGTLVKGMILVGAVVVLRASTLVVPLFNTDEAYLAIQGRVLADGGRMYHDVADRKPPLVPYLYAAIFKLRGGDDLLAVRLMMMAWIVATALVLAWTMWRRAGPQAAWWAAGLYVLATVSYLPADAMAANFELFMALPTCLGMALAGEFTPAGDLAAGALIGTATLCKQQAGVTLVAAGYCALRARHPLARAVLLLAGFGGVIAAAAALVGPRELYFWNIGGNRGYVTADGLTAPLLRGLLSSIAFMLANGALTFLVVLAARRRQPRTAGLWVWLGSAALGAAIGLRFFGHYYFQLLPPACLLAAPMAAALSGGARRRLTLWLAVPAVGFAVAGFFAPELHGMPDYRRLAAYVRDHTRPGDRIAIWGHYPEVYWASGRRPATRFVHTGFLTGASSGRPVGAVTEPWAMPGAWEMFFDDLAAHPPRLFIDTAPAALRDYEHYPIARYPRLRDYLARQYREQARLDGMVIYEPLPSSNPGLK